MDVLRDPSKPLPAGESVLSDITKSFWSRTVALASPSSAQQLVESLGHYIEAVCEEAEDREYGRVRSIEDFLVVRRGSCGSKSCFNFLLLSVDLPEEVITHPHIERVTLTAIDLIVLSNDVYSYNFERADGQDGHNTIAAVMKEKALEVQDAMDYTGQVYHWIAKKFVDDIKIIPSFSESIDPLVSEYVLGLGNWVTALHEWSFENERYFGTRGPEIKASRIVELFQK